MADEPLAPAPWITIQLIAPGPNARWAGLNGAPSTPGGPIPTAAVQVDFMALQHQRDFLEGEQEDDAPVETVVDARIVPVVLDTNGSARMLEPGVTGFVGLAGSKEEALSLAIMWATGAAARAAAATAPATTTTTTERKDTDGP